MKVLSVKFPNPKQLQSFVSWLVHGGGYDQYMDYLEQRHEHLCSLSVTGEDKIVIEQDTESE